MGIDTRRAGAWRRGHDATVGDGPGRADGIGYRIVGADMQFAGTELGPGEIAIAQAAALKRVVSVVSGEDDKHPTRVMRAAFDAAHKSYGWMQAG